MVRHVALLIAVAVALPVPAAPDGNEVPYPEGFRRWAHVKSTYVPEETTKAGPYRGMQHIYANPAALEGFATGRFADGAMLAFDVLEVKLDAGTVQEGPRKFTDVMFKDSKRFASTGGWGFEEFTGAARTRALDAPKAAACFACHEKRSPQTFVISTPRD
jgi:hypothetical protein